MVAWPKLLATETEGGGWIPVAGHEKQSGGEMIRHRDCWMREQVLKTQFRKAQRGRLQKADPLGVSQSHLALARLT